MAHPECRPEVFELAEYFGNMLFVPANENFDAVLAEKGKAIHLADCAMCHIGEDPGGAPQETVSPTAAEASAPTRARLCASRPCFMTPRGWIEDRL